MQYIDNDVKEFIEKYHFNTDDFTLLKPLFDKVNKYNTNDKLKLINIFICFAIRNNNINLVKFIKKLTQYSFLVYMVLHVNRTRNIYESIQHTKFHLAIKKNKYLELKSML